MEELRNNSMWWHGPEWVKDLWPNWDVPEVTEEQLNDLLEVSGPKNIYEVSNLVGENNLKMERTVQILRPHPLHFWNKRDRLFFFIQIITYICVC